MAIRIYGDPPMAANGRLAADERRSGDGSMPDNPGPREQGERSLLDELKLLRKQFHELGESFSGYVTAKADSVKLSLRRIVLWAALAAIGFVAVGALIVIASWLMLSGIAEGLGALFGDRPWLGSLTTGFLLLAGLGLATYCTLAKRNTIARNRAAEKYERLKSQTK